MNHKTTKDRVKEIMDDKGINVARLSRETHIPSARIYKWFKDGLQPKSADEKVLKKWVEEIEEVPHETPKDATNEAKASLERSIENMTLDKLKSTAIIENLALDKVHSTALMERLVSLLEVKFGVKDIDKSEFPPTGAANTENLRHKKKRH